MNSDICKTLTIAANTSQVAKYACRAAEILVDYGIRGISGVGTLINVITILVLLQKVFKGKFYDFLRCRCVCNCVICSICVFYRNDGILEGAEEVYVRIWISWYVFAIALRIALLAAFIADNLIVLNRLANLYDKKQSIFYTLSKKVSLSDLESF